MTFPDTSLTLIERLTSGGSDDDWRWFFRDYWGPVCRFSLRVGARNPNEAEEIASQTFEAIWRNRLLDRWVSNQASRLRSLLCTVIRRIVSNTYRNQTREDARRHYGRPDLDHLEQSSDEAEDSFYAAWVEEVVAQAVESLATEYCRKNQTDRIRVLYGRLCEGLSIAQVSTALDLKTSTVDFYFRDARDRLTRSLQAMLRPQIERYCSPDQAEDEFSREWQRLGDYLASHGGLDEAVRRSYATLAGPVGDAFDRARMDEAIRRLAAFRCPPNERKGYI